MLVAYIIIARMLEEAAAFCGGAGAPQPGDHPLLRDWPLQHY